MTEANQKVLYDHFVKKGMTKEAEEIDKVYNFSGKKDKNVLEKIADKKKAKK